MPVITPSPVRCGADLQRLEQTPLAHAVPWASTYNLIRDTVHAYPDRTALTFLHAGQPDSPSTRWTYRMLLEGMHQTANLLRELDLGFEDVPAVMLWAAWSWSNSPGAWSWPSCS